MKEKEIQKYLNETRDLLEIPYTSKILKHKILELKELLSENIDDFRDPYDKEETQLKLPGKGERFEISRIGEHLWVPSLPDNPTSNVYDIIPDIIVDHIIGINVNEGDIRMESGLRFPGLKRRVFNLIFEKHNNNFYSGILKEITPNNCDIDYPENMSKWVEIFGKGEKKSDKIDVIKMLLYHLFESDSFFNHVASEYFMRWKPLFDQQLLIQFQESFNRTLP